MCGQHGGAFLHNVAVVKVARIVGSEAVMFDGMPQAAAAEGRLGGPEIETAGRVPGDAVFMDKLRLVVGAPAADEPPGDVVAAGHLAKARRGEVLLGQGLKFAGEGGRDFLVGIKHEDPVVAALGDHELALGVVAGPVVVDHAGLRGMVFRDGDGAVRAAGIDDHHVVGPGDGIESRRDLGRLVPTHDAGGNGDHGGSLAGKGSDARAGWAWKGKGAA